MVVTLRRLLVWDSLVNTMGWMIAIRNFFRLILNYLLHNGLPEGGPYIKGRP
jgi:hypothetical protein